MKKIILSFAALSLLAAPGAFAIENFSLNPFTGFKNCNPCKVEKTCPCKKEKVKCKCKVEKPCCPKPKCDKCKTTGAAAPCPTCRRTFR